MPVSASSSERFRQARERSGLSVDQVAERMGIQSPCIWDIESHGDELASVYSPAELQRFAQVLGVTPAELLGIASPGEPISAAQLVELVHEHRRVRGCTVAQLEDAVGWRLAGILEPPALLLQEITIDGLQWLCRELAVDWRRVIIGL